MKLLILIDKIKVVTKLYQIQNHHAQYALYTLRPHPSKGHPVHYVYDVYL